jgi:hypothetical protein
MAPLREAVFELRELLLGGGEFAVLVDVSA